MAREGGEVRPTAIRTAQRQLTGGRRIFFLGWCGGQRWDACPAEPNKGVVFCGLADELDLRHVGQWPTTSRRLCPSDVDGRDSKAEGGRLG